MSSGPLEENTFDDGFAQVYDDLRRVAHGLLSRPSEGATVQPTALVHEAYLRLACQPDVAGECPETLLAITARTMRRILVEHARARAATKRGGDLVRVDLDAERLDLPDDGAAELVMIDDALVALERASPRLARVVECRFFGGFTPAETAEALGVSLRTAEREWARARAHLRVLMAD